MRARRVGDTITIEPAQRDPIEPLGAAEVRQQRAERMCPIDLGVAIGADHQAS